MSNSYSYLDHGITISFAYDTNSLSTASKTIYTKEQVEEVKKWSVISTMKIFSYEIKSGHVVPFTITIESENTRDVQSIVIYILKSKITRISGMGTTFKYNKRSKCSINNTKYYNIDDITSINIGAIINLILDNLSNDETS